MIVSIGLLQHDTFIKIFIGKNSNEILYKINCWLFDFYRVRKKEILQLPPIDEWTHSEEDCSFWQYKLDESYWTVSLYTNTIQP